MRNRLSGINPIAYIGVDPYTPPEIVHKDRNPTTQDREYDLGTFWHVFDSEFIFMLADLRFNTPTWIQISPGGGSGAANFETDDGTATIVGGLLDYFGDVLNIQTSSTGNTINIRLVDDVEIVGTFTMSALGAGVVQQTDAGFISDNGTNGQLLIGATGSDVAWSSMTSSGTVTFTTGANSLELVEGTLADLVITGDDMGTATPSMGEISAPDATNISTTGAGSTMTINLNNDVTIGNDLTLSGNMVIDVGLTVFGNLILPNEDEGVMLSDGGEISGISGLDGETLIGGGTTNFFASIQSNTITITEGANTIDLSISGGGGSADPFLVSKSSNAPLYGSGATATFGDQSPLTIFYDVGTNFYAGDGMGLPATFTAPMDGKFHLCFRILCTQGSAGINNPTNVTWRARMVTPSWTIEFNYNDRSIVGAGPTTSSSQMRGYFTPIVDLDMGDEVTFTVTQVTLVGGSLWFIDFSNALANPIGTFYKTVIHGYQVA